jgi:rubrerythrin
MSDNSQESVHALIMAMHNELDTIQIYEHILKYLSDAKARELLHRLIVEEHNHEQEIKEKIISAGGEVPQPDAKPHEDFPNREQLLDLELENCTVSELVNLAIENERMSRDFYLAQQDRATSPEVKAIFKWLVAQEEEHIRNLKAEYGDLLG